MMNIKISSINNLLKLILIFSISLAIVNSISAQEVNPSTLKSQQTRQTNPAQQTIKNNLNTNKPIERESEPKEIEREPQESSQSEPLQQNPNNKNSESFLILDSLVYIDLPIVLILLLLWYLNKNQQQQLFTQIDEKQDQLLGKLNKLKELDSKLNNLDKIKREIIKEIQENNPKNTNSEIRLFELLSKQQFNQSANHNNSLMSDTSHLNSIAIIDKISQFVETYNQDKKLSPERIIATVKSTQENVEQRRTGNIDTVTLETTTQKKYWIIEEDNDYYLIPHAKIRIDEHNKTTLESLFDCTNFTSEYSDFQLVKPAKVSKLSSETWQLEEKGQLNFD